MRRLTRVVERRSVQELKRMYDAAYDDLLRKLRKVSGRASDEFTAHQLRAMLVQVREGQIQIARELSGGLSTMTEKVQIESLRALIDNVHRLEKHFTGSEITLPIEEAARFRGVITGRRESMLREQEVSLANYGTEVVGKMENELSQSLLAGETLGDTIARIEEVGDVEWWRAERIARTESLFAFNATQADGLAESSAELPDMGMRWEERVDDFTYEPLDARVNEDSIAMHGQVANLGESFGFPNTMPGGGPVPTELSTRYAGERWSFPPMRPNDRATITPWRAHWGIPGWRLVGGNRVPIK